MDALARLEHELNRSRQAWQGSTDPVRRMALLRELFREVHRLYNEVLADRSAPSSEEIRSLHAMLERLPGNLESQSPVALQSELSSRRDLLQFLERWSDQESGSNVREEQTEISKEKPPLPEFLDRPDRAWERLIWRAAFDRAEWKLHAITERHRLQEFAASAQSRERELSARGIVLAMTCLTSSGDIRDWQWHYLSPKGDPP
jgi:hypothetical protein